MSNLLIFRNPYFDLQPMDLISIRGGSSPKEYGQYLLQHRKVHKCSK